MSKGLTGGRRDVLAVDNADLEVFAHFSAGFSTKVFLFASPLNYRVTRVQVRS